MASSAFSSVEEGVASAAKSTAEAVPLPASGPEAEPLPASGPEAEPLPASGPEAEPLPASGPEVEALPASGTEAAAGAAGNADRKVQSSNFLKFARLAAKVATVVAGSAAAGMATTLTAGVVTLKAVGFTAAGPAAGSDPAAWMSSIATTGGGNVGAGSVYSMAQSAAMSGDILLGAPAVLAGGAVVGSVVGGVALYKDWI